MKIRQILRFISWSFKKRHVIIITLFINFVFVIYSFVIFSINQHEQKKNIKYILVWTPYSYCPFYYPGKGHRQFIVSNGSMVNCYVTSNRSFFGDNITDFDAIAFNGGAMQHFTKKDFPKARSPHQKYIFFNMESADNEPICHDFLNDVFNWTATYKLNSDILFNYILIKDKYGKIVGPKEKMEWVETTGKIDNSLKKILQEKSKAAAWFVSNCNSRSEREEFVYELQRALKAFHLRLDIYGYCGTFICPRKHQYICNALLDRHYYFYLSLENSFAEDYVTEKLLQAVQNNIVPIVFGGADYSRFLPPKSYLNGLNYSPAQLAELMASLIRSPDLYEQYFRWKNYYSYEDAMEHSICSLCEALNDRSMVETTSIYTDFKTWWNVRKDPDQCEI